MPHDALHLFYCHYLFDFSFFYLLHFSGLNLMFDYNFYQRCPPICEDDIQPLECFVFLANYWVYIFYSFNLSRTFCHSNLKVGKRSVPSKTRFLKLIISSRYGACIRGTKFQVYQAISSSFNRLTHQINLDHVFDVEVEMTKSMGWDLGRVKDFRRMSEGITRLWFYTKNLFKLGFRIPIQ